MQDKNKQYRYGLVGLLWGSLPGILSFFDGLPFYSILLLPLGLGSGILLYCVAGIRNNHLRKKMSYFSIGLLATTIPLVVIVMGASLPFGFRGLEPLLFGGVLISVIFSVLFSCIPDIQKYLSRDQ
jgi:hypothetical protein